MGTSYKVHWIMMRSMIWLLVAFLAGDASELYRKDNLPKSDIPLARPEAVEAFKSLLHKALDSDGTYHRDLLITAGIVPAPPDYESPKDDGSGRPQEMPLTPEMQEHFNTHIKDILTSLEKLDYALNRLFGEWILPSHFVDFKDSWHQKLAEHLKLHNPRNEEEFEDVSKDHSILEQPFTKIDCNVEVNSRSAACKERLSEIPELPSLPAVDFIMTSESELASENEFVTSASVVDRIVTEYIKIFYKTSESPTQPSNLRVSEGDRGVTLTPLDEDFVMHIVSSSVSPTLDEFSSAADESTFSEKENKQKTEFLSASDATVDYSKDSEESGIEFDSNYLSSKYGKVLTFEEVQLLDQSLPRNPELKYNVISTSLSDLNTLSDVHFFTTDEASSPESISKKRRRINPRDIYPGEPIFYQAPTPEKMLLRYYRDIPDTSFTCENKTIPGFYADQETDCQVFHVCWPGRRESFLCPVGSLFNQRVLSCDKFNNTNCSLSHAYFDVNTAFKEYDDAKALNVTPMPDPMMNPIQNDSGTTEVVATKSEIAELFEADLHFSEMVNKTDIAELWDYLPVKAKVFVYPEPADLKEFLAQFHHHKIRKSKDVRGIDTTESEDDSVAGISDDILEKRLRIEANIIRVLKKLSRKHRN